MTTAVVALGIIIGALGALCALRPSSIDDLLSVWEQPYAMTLAVAIRLVAGLILLAAAPQCRWTPFVRTLGVVTMFSAMLLPMLGRERIDTVLAWFAALPPAVLSVYGLAVFALGTSLVYAASV